MTKIYYSEISLLQNTCSLITAGSGWGCTLINPPFLHCKFFFHPKARHSIFSKFKDQQESIPVGCVPSASAAITRCQLCGLYLRGCTRHTPPHPQGTQYLDTPGSDGDQVYPTPSPDRHTPMKTLPSRYYVGRQ